jgi:hypothetical protein
MGIGGTKHASARKTWSESQRKLNFRPQSKSDASLLHSDDVGVASKPVRQPLRYLLTSLIVPLSSPTSRDLLPLHLSANRDNPLYLFPIMASYLGFHNTTVPHDLSGTSSIYSSVNFDDLNWAETKWGSCRALLLASLPLSFEADLRSRFLVSQLNGT